MEKVRKYYLQIFILLLVLLGIELRVAVSNVPMWYDEGHSILVAIKNFPFGIDNFLYTKDFQHTPFYFYFLHFWLKIFGTNEILLRMSSAIFGIATIPLTYIVGKKLYNKNVGIISALLVTVSPLLVYYSIEIRMYAAVTFLAVLSMNYLLDYEENPNKKTLAKLLLANTLIPYLLIGGIVFYIGQIISYSIYLFVTQKDNTEKIGKYFVYQVYQFILLIPYFVIAIYYAIQRSHFMMFHIPSFEFMHFLGNLQNYFATRVGMLFWVNYMPFYINFVFFVAIIIPIIYFINALIKAFKEKNAKLYMVFLTVIISYGIILISAMMKIVVIVPRYTIFIVPLVMVLAAVGFSKLSKWHAASFLVFFSVLSIFFLFHDNAYYQTKYNALYDSLNYFASRNLNGDDLVYRPFASSVAFIYETPGTPKAPPFEALHEFRKPDNDLIYDDYQIEQFKKGNIDETWLNIIQSEGHISKRFYEFMKKTYLEPLKAGRYIVMAVYGPDNQALIERKDYVQNYNTAEKVHQDRILSSLCKIFDDSKNIFLEQCDLVEVISINDTTYLLFRKRPYKK